MKNTQENDSNSRPLGKKNRADSSDLHPTASYEEINRASPYKLSHLTLSNKIFWLGPERFHPLFFKRNRIRCSQRFFCPPHCRVLQQIWIPNAIILIKCAHSWLNISSNVDSLHSRFPQHSLRFNVFCQKKSFNICKPSNENLIRVFRIAGGGMWLAEWACTCFYSGYDRPWTQQ